MHDNDDGKKVKSNGEEDSSNEDDDDDDAGASNDEEDTSSEEEDGLNGHEGPTNVIDNVGPSNGNAGTTKVSAGASNDCAHALTGKFLFLFLFFFSLDIYILLLLVDAASPSLTRKFFYSFT